MNDEDTGDDRNRADSSRLPRLGLILLKPTHFFQISDKKPELKDWFFFLEKLILHLSENMGFWVFFLNLSGANNIQ